MIDIFFEKIYYINLDRDINRKNYIIDLFTKNTSLADQLHRFPGIDGKIIDINNIDDSIISNKAREDILAQKQRIFGITLTYGSLGCALSHKKLWEQCSVATKPYFILEDDIILDKNFNTKLEETLSSIANYTFDIFYLGCYEIHGFKQKTINNLIAKPDGLITGLYGYIVTPTGAKKLLDNIFPLTNQIDSSIGHNNDKLDLLCAKQKIIFTKQQFGSNTQRDKSCQNNIQKNNYTDWNKLFQ